MVRHTFLRFQPFVIIGDIMPNFELDKMKQFVAETYQPESPLREIILQEKGDVDDPEVWMAKFRIWFHLSTLEKHIEYRIKEKYKYKYS